jgi:ubiquinone/menaquinone biosynthesis C-methylase UbiE
MPANPPVAQHRPHLIPAWMVPLLSLPLRRIWDPPERLVLPLVHPGDRILEVGPGSGFFTFPMAKAAGPGGRLFCVELQETVLGRLRRGVAGRGLGQVEVRPCGADDLRIQDLEASMDLAVAIDVLHETPDPASTLRQMAAALRPGGVLLIREPRGHCPAPLFQAELAWAVLAGLEPRAGALDFGPRAQVALFRKAGPDQGDVPARQGY